MSKKFVAEEFNWGYKSESEDDNSFKSTYAVDGDAAVTEKPEIKLCANPIISNVPGPKLEKENNALSDSKKDTPFNQCTPKEAIPAEGRQRSKTCVIC